MYNLIKCHLYISGVGWSSNTEKIRGTEGWSWRWSSKSSNHRSRWIKRVRSFFYLRMRITTVVITAARNTKPPNTPRAITAPRFSLAWWVPLGCSALSTRKGPDGSGTPAPIPACAWSTLWDISLSCGCSLPVSTDVGSAGLRPIVGLLETVSLTVAGSSAVPGTILDGLEVVTGVPVLLLVVVLTLGVRYVRVFVVDGRIVARVGETMVARESSGTKKLIYWIYKNTCTKYFI